MFDALTGLLSDIGGSISGAANSAWDTVSGWGNNVGQTGVPPVISRTQRPSGDWLAGTEGLVIGDDRIGDFVPVSVGGPGTPAPSWPQGYSVDAAGNLVEPQGLGGLAKDVGSLAKSAVDLGAPRVPPQPVAATTIQPQPVNLSGLDKYRAPQAQPYQWGRWR